MNFASKNTKLHLFQSVFICSLASLFYVYDFVIRVIPGTIEKHLLLQFGITAAGFGFLSSFFFIGYTLLQIPAGLLYDRYGPRLLLTVTTFISAISTFFFIATPHYFIAASARFFMGASSAFAFIGAVVLVARWLPLRYFAFATGLIQFMGSMGAIIGEAPIAKLAEYFGEYLVIVYVSVAGIILALAFWIFIIDFPANVKEIHEAPIKVWSHLKYILKKSQNWMTAIYGFAIWAPMAVFASLWAIPFLRNLYQISNARAATLASFIWLGVAIGSPIIGWYSNYIESRRIPLIISAFFGVISSIIILYASNISQNIMMLLLFLFGLAGAGQALTFGLVIDNNAQRYTGTAAGFNNMAIVFGGVILQPLVGILLNWYAMGQIENSVHIYSVNDYRFALLVMPVCFIIALLTILFFIRETHCQPVTE